MPPTLNDCPVLDSDAIPIRERAPRLGFGANISLGFFEGAVDRNNCAAVRVGELDYADL